MAAIPTAVPGVVVLKESWAQCENANCQKWRKLPPGTEVGDDAWYCYMSPDPRRNRCSASEESYDEKTEIVLPADGHLDDEEALHNQLIKRHLEATIAAAAAMGASAAARGKGRGRGAGSGGRRGRGGGRGRGRGAGKGGAMKAEPGFEPYPSLQLQQQSLQSKRQRTTKDELDDDAGSPVGTALHPAGRAIPTRTRRQHAAHFLRSLENRGSWEGVAGAASAALPAFAPPPAAVWDALSQQAPELAAVACQAADVASSVRYFEDTQVGKAAADEAGLIARLALMLSSACALAGAEDSLLTPQERARTGLPGGAPTNPPVGVPAGPAPPPAAVPQAGGGGPVMAVALPGVGGPAQGSGTALASLPAGPSASGLASKGQPPLHHHALAPQQQWQQQQPSSLSMNGRATSTAAQLPGSSQQLPPSMHQQPPAAMQPSPGHMAGQWPPAVPLHMQQPGGLGSMSSHQLQMMQQRAAGAVPGQLQQLPPGGLTPPGLSQQPSGSLASPGMPQPPRGSPYAGAPVAAHPGPPLSTAWPMAPPAASLPLVQPQGGMQQLQGAPPGMPQWQSEAQRQMMQQLGQVPGGAASAVDSMMAFHAGPLAGGLMPMPPAHGLGGAQQQQQH